MNGGVGQRARAPSRSSAGSRARRRTSAAAARARALCCSRSCVLQLAVLLRRTPARRSSLSRLDTTSTTREASSTCTVGLPYSGAIFTAVCCWLVVAPPMRSGSRDAARSISLATNTISSSDGVMRPLRPMRSACSSIARLQDPVARHHHAEIDDLVAVAAEHDADDVLADVVHVALDRREHDLALCRRFGRSAGGHPRLAARPP